MILTAADAAVHHVIAIVTAEMTDVTTAAMTDGMTVETDATTAVMTDGMTAGTDATGIK